MKVVIIGSAHPFRGGLATYNERLAREYIEHGHDVTIFTFSLQYPGFLFPGKTQYSSSPPPEGLNIRVCINSINPINWYFAGKKIARMKPDLVIIKFWIPFMGPCFGTLARQIRKNKHSKLISIIDNIIPHEHRFGDKPFARYFVKGMDGFVTMSRAVLDEMKIFTTTKKCLYCPHPLYDNFGESVARENALKEIGLSEDFRYILFFGFIRDYKGLDLLLKAMADSLILNKKIKLLIAGEYYTDSAPYKKLIADNNLSDRVIEATDFIPDEKVRYYFSACDLVVQPYKSATQSGVTQIAYHFEKPMIVTDVGGLAEMVPHGKVGYIVKPEPEDIAKHIDIFFSQNQFDVFRDGLIQEKKKYSWHRMIETIEEIRNS